MKNFKISIVLFFFAFSLPTVSFSQQYIDCSETDCTCIVTLEVVNNNGEDFKLGFGYGLCHKITAAGEYTYKLDVEFDHLLGLLGNTTNVDLTINISSPSCTVTPSVIQMGSANSNGVSWSVVSIDRNCKKNPKGNNKLNR